jgi:hypothetical protein
MEPNRFGRKLGIGVRVASRMAKERVAQASAASPTQATTPPPRPSAAPRPLKNYAEPARRIGEGTRRFGKAFIGPLAHVSGTLWLEITGTLFALFAAFFGQYAWRARAGILHSPERAHFLVFALATLVFLYFALSSFIKASRRGKRSAQ